MALTPRGGTPQSPQPQSEASPDFDALKNRLEQLLNKAESTANVLDSLVAEYRSSTKTAQGVQAYLIHVDTVLSGDRDTAIIIMNAGIAAISAAFGKA